MPPSPTLSPDGKWLIICGSRFNIELVSFSATLRMATNVGLHIQRDEDGIIAPLGYAAAINRVVYTRVKNS